MSKEKLEHQDTPQPDAEALREENKRIRYLRYLVSLTSAELLQGDITLDEARAIVERTRRAALALFPGKEDAFELIYRPRFDRIIRERYGDTSEGPVH